MKRFFSGLFAALVVVLSAAPFLYVFVRSFLSPGGVTFQYYYDVFLASPKYLFRFWKSIGMAVCIAAGQLLISVFAGFGFAKYKFPGRNFLFFLLMILMTLPVQVTLVPDFIMLGYMNLLNTYAALILPSIIVPLGTFILTQSFKSVPDTVLDAAMLDGCGVLRMLFYVVSPMNKSGLVCVLLLSFLDAWNMVEQPLVYLQDVGSYPLSVFLASRYMENLPFQFVCSVLSLLPLALCFLYFGEDLLQSAGRKGDAS